MLHYLGSSAARYHEGVIRALVLAALLQQPAARAPRAIHVPRELPTVQQAIDSASAGVLSAGGGGVRIGFADPILEHNVITNNRGRYGAGVVLFYAAATVRGNEITGNSGGEDFGGAGLWAWGQLTRRLPNVIEGNVIRGNRALGADGRSHFRRTPQAGKGGGLSLRGAGAVLRNNVVSGNTPNDTEELP